MEGVINDHLVYLHGKSNMYHFEQLNFNQKLSYLSEHEIKLKMVKEVNESKDKKSKADSFFKRLRLEGVTLSYDLYESQTFKKIKEIQ